jgi:hypothetical protein
MHFTCYDTFKTTYKLKSNILPFGGINIMFMEDFLQFSPIFHTIIFHKHPTNQTHKINSKKMS